LIKNAYFQGEQVTGKVVLGAMTKILYRLVLLCEIRSSNGQAKIAITAGGVGEQNFEGNLLLLKTENNL
jgi:hypothetical protein